jgi:predicted F0F1-ATPase subunit
VSSNDERQDKSSADKRGELPKVQLSSSGVHFWKHVANMTSVGWSTVLPIAGGVLLGHYLDRYTGSKYVWTVGLLVGGIMVAFYNLYHILTRDMRE